MTKNHDPHAEFCMLSETLHICAGIPAVLQFAIWGAPTCERHKQEAIARIQEEYRARGIDTRENDTIA